MPVCFILLLALAPLQDTEIDRLIRALDSDHVEERERAERRLAEIGVRARPALQRAAAEGSTEKVARVRTILRAPAFRTEDLFDAGFRRETAAAIPDFARRFNSTVPADRSGAVRDLAGRASPEDLTAIAKILGREDLPDEIRLACADLMEKVKRPELTPLVIPLLEPRFGFTVSRVVSILAASGAKEAAPALQPLLENRNHVQATLVALEKLSCPVPDEAVRRMLRSREDTVRWQAVALIEKQERKGFSVDLIGLLGNGGDATWFLQQTLIRERPSWTELKPLLEAGKPAVRLLSFKVIVATRLPEALDAAVVLLEDPDEDMRREALEFVVALKGDETVRRLSTKGGPQALIALARIRAKDPDARAAAALGARDPATRRAGITALRSLDSHDLAGAIVPLLNDADPGVRAEAARVLPHLAGDSVGPSLAARLAKEEDPQVQTSLLDAIAETGCQAAAPQVLKLLQDPKGKTGPAAIRAAGSLRIKEAAPLLVRGYVTGKSGDFHGAYEALLQIRPDNLVDLLKPFLTPPKKNFEEPLRGHRIMLEPEGSSQKRAIYLLFVDPPGGKELLVESLKNGIRSDFPVEMIRFLGAEEAFPWLIETLQKGSEQQAHGAGRLLASYGRRDLLGFMIDRLYRGDYGEAIEYLGGIKPAEKVGEFEQRLDDPDAAVRDRAWSVLQWVGGPRVDEVFRRRLREGTPGDRAYAARFLLSPNAQDMPFIEALLDSDDPAVRVEGVYALYLRRSKGSFDHVVKAYQRGTQATDWVWPYAFTSLGDARGRTLVRAMIDSERNPEKLKALFTAMGQGDGFVAADAVLVERFFSDPKLAVDAFKVLMRMDPDRAVERLADPRFRMSMPQGNWAVSALEYVKTPAAVRALKSFLTDRESQNRIQAASMLGRRGATEAAEALAKLLHDEDLRCRGEAAIALARLGDARGLKEILRLPRRTTVNQGRMHDALWALNFIRQPEATRKLAGIEWTYDGPSSRTLQEALEELGRRTGLKLTLSPSLSVKGLRSPRDWPRAACSAEEILSEAPWRRFVTFVVEPDQIRVLTPDEAFRFWDQWAKDR